jgi:hypothetical protein
LCGLVLGCAVLAATIPIVEAAPPDKVATIICQPGWRGTAVGAYGGVSFGVSCNNGRGNERIRGVTGTAYSIRMGVETSSGAADCAFSGDSETVSVACVEVALEIQ